MRYKVGDKVRVKSRDWYEKNQIDGEVDCGGVPFTAWLATLCGTTQIIEAIEECFRGSYYRFKNVQYLWNDLMLEGTADFPLADDKALYDELYEFEEFKKLVKRMREAQRNYYKDRPKVGYKVAYQNMINKEQLVDEYLKKMEE